MLQNEGDAFFMVDLGREQAMHVSWCWWLLALVAAVGVASEVTAAPPPAGDASHANSQRAGLSETPAFSAIHAELEQMAGDLPYLSVDCVLLDCPEPFYKAANPEDDRCHERILSRLLDLQYAPEVLQKLCSDENAKVRTLAMVALFDREDPSHLPRFVSLADDRTPTFDAYPPFAAAGFGIEPGPRTQAVGDVAQRMVEFYLGKAGIQCGNRRLSQPDFEDYWAARKDRPYSASWFSVQWARAAQGSLSPSPERVDRLRAVRHRIDRLPADDHAWTLLWLHGSIQNDMLVTEKELVDVAQELGPDKLLLMLQHEIPCDDPDIRRGGGAYTAMMLWVLKHSAQLLRLDQAPAVEACADRPPLPCSSFMDSLLEPSPPTQRKLRSPWWMIASADLQPERATAILHAAMAEFNKTSDGAHRAELAVALWRLGRTTEIPYLVDWFYDEPVLMNQSPDPRAQFLHQLAENPVVELASLVAAIVDDPRFSDLGYRPVKELKSMTDGWTRHDRVRTPPLPEWKASIRTWRAMWSAEENR